jgi:thiol-disulfide isomerase/thioredoxin
MMLRALRVLPLALALGAGPAAVPAQQSVSLDPLFHASEGWLNGGLSRAALAGKVVIVDVFTFGCYNCKNVLPNLRALYHPNSSDVAIVGIHTPETPYERERANVVANLKVEGVVWPVAIDNSHALWDAFNIEYWPTQLIFDRKGHLRKTVVGDSQDAEVNATVKELVAEK